MKGNKICFGLFSLLAITLGLSLSVCSEDTSALRYEYNGIGFLSSHLCVSYNEDSELWYLNYNYPCSNLNASGGSSFKISFEGDSYQSSYDNLNLPRSSSYLQTSIEDNKNNFERVIPMFYYGEDNVGDSYKSFGEYAWFDTWYYNDLWHNVPSSEHRRGPLANFQESTIPNALLVCNVLASDNHHISNLSANGAKCGGLWNVGEYLNDQVLPYWYSYDGFYIHSRAIDVDGTSYTNTFSLSDFFNQKIPTFSYLRIPLGSYDGYFENPSNLTVNRSFEFAGYFDFDDGFEWHSNIQTNGSYFRLHYDGMTKYDGSDSPIDDYVDCTTNLITLGGGNGLTRLEYHCPVTLDSDYLYFNPYLEISGNGNYVWTTNGDWRFNALYLITDNDDSFGGYFNSDLTGGGEIPGDAENNIPDNESFDNWFNDLVNSFSFDFVNPFAPIFDLFNNDSCANIPTLASMLHSNETQVCPWFDSTTRNIATPVLGLSSMMLLFGFVVRWLGARSGNFFEDSGSIAPPGDFPAGSAGVQHVGWRRRK